MFMMPKASLGCLFCYLFFLFWFLNVWEFRIETMNFSKQNDVSYDVRYNI